MQSEREKSQGEIHSIADQQNRRWSRHGARLHSPGRAREASVRLALHILRLIRYPALSICRVVWTDQLFAGFQGSGRGMHVIEINLVYCCSRSDRIETKGIAKFPRIGSSESQKKFPRKFDWLRIHGRCRSGGGTSGKNSYVWPELSLSPWPRFALLSHSIVNQCPD